MSPLATTRGPSQLQGDERPQRSEGLADGVDRRVATSNQLWRPRRPPGPRVRPDGAVRIGSRCDAGQRGPAAQQVHRPVERGPLDVPWPYVNPYATEGQRLILMSAASAHMPLRREYVAVSSPAWWSHSRPWLVSGNA